MDGIAICLVMGVKECLPPSVAPRHASGNPGRQVAVPLRPACRYYGTYGCRPGKCRCRNENPTEVMSATTQVLPGYRLAAPTAADVLTSLARLDGPERASEIWAEACRAVDAAPVGEPALAMLEAICAHLKAQGGIVGVIGSSLLVRIQSYVLLSDKVTA